LLNNHALGQNTDYYGYGTVPRYTLGSGRGVEGAVGRVERRELDPFFVPALPINNGKDDSPKKGKKARKMSESKQPTFLTKLYG
jgi:hypothetical protein